MSDACCQAGDGCCEDPAHPRAKTGGRIWTDEYTRKHLRDDHGLVATDNDPKGFHRLIHWPPTTHSHPKKVE